jgi:hypothetical protein
MNPSDQSLFDEGGGWPRGLFIFMICSLFASSSSGVTTFLIAQG